MNKIVLLILAITSIAIFYQNNRSIVLSENFDKSEIQDATSIKNLQQEVFYLLDDGLTEDHVENIRPGQCIVKYLECAIKKSSNCPVYDRIIQVVNINYGKKTISGVPYLGDRIKDLSKLGINKYELSIKRSQTEELEFYKFERETGQPWRHWHSSSCDDISKDYFFIRSQFKE